MFDFYKKIVEIYNFNDNYNKFFEYFENTCLSLNNEIEAKYPIDLWSYDGKYTFQRTRRKLIGEDRLRQYLIFSNNECESINHFINSHIHNNLKVCLTRFEYILEGLFIRTETNIFNRKDKVLTLKTKTQLTDKLIELVGLGYGKNGKMIKNNDLKNIKNLPNEEELFGLIHGEC